MQGYLLARPLPADEAQALLGRDLLAAPTSNRPPAAGERLAAASVA